MYQFGNIVAVGTEVMQKNMWIILRQELHMAV